jgi:thiol-disulfide isomerase/thioredoxin
MMRPALVLVSLLALATSSAHAGDAPAGGDGLKPGTPAPTFTLPVVNDFVPPVVPTGPLAPKQTKWGPARWTGEKPDEQKKLVIMSFFATYCEPCKKEMPELSRLYDTYKDQGLGVMLVSIDKGDEQRQTIIDLAKENKVAFPVMHDRYQVVARRYAAERLPYMLMLDPTGTVKVVHVGYTDDLKANLENEVRGHLGLEPLPPPAPPAPATPEKGTKGAKGTEKAGDKATPEKAPKGPKAPAKS